MIKRSLLKRLRPISRRRGAVSAGLVAAFGGLFVWQIFASGTPVAFESESGTLAGCATTASNAQASGGSAVKFGCSSGGASALDLDASGNTIPDTNYTAPAGSIYMDDTGNDANPGTQAAPIKTLDRAVALVPVDGTVVVRGGVYRDWYTGGTGNYKIATKSMTFQAYPHEQVWFDGTDVQATGSWTSDGSGHWYKDWNTPTFCNGGYYSFPYNAQPTTNLGPCSHYDEYGDPAYPAAGDPQMVFIDTNRMQEVATLANATGGNFYYDWTAKRIYISTNPTGHTVELAARPNAFVGGGATSQYAFKGIGFRRYATDEYDNITSAAVYIGGYGHATFENTVFTQNAGIGLSAKPLGLAVRSSVFAFNGFNGMGSNGSSSSGGTDNLSILGSVFNNNNLEHYGLNCTLSCAASGIKMGHMVGYTIKDSVFENNQGVAGGAWCDTACSGGVFVNNLVRDNGGSGLHYEIDDTGIIASNVFINNGYGVNVGSTNTKIYNNTFINNKTISIRLYDDSRAMQTANLEVVNNITYGKSVNDNWFANGGGQVGPDTFISAFDYNSYWRPTNFVLYRWIDGADTSYNSNTNFRVAHPAWESHAQDFVAGADPFFVDFAGGNYNLRSDSAAYHSGAALPPDVAAALGVPTAAGGNRGALSWPGH